MTPSDLAVLSDFLLERLPPDEAAKRLAWMQYPGAVEFLLYDQRVARCPACRAFVPHGAPHDADCWYIEALRLLRDDRLVDEVGYMHATAVAWNAETPFWRATQSDRWVNTEEDARGRNGYEIVVHRVTDEMRGEMRRETNIAEEPGADMSGEI